MRLITEAILRTVHERYNAGIEAQKGYVARILRCITKYIHDGLFTDPQFSL